MLERRGRKVPRVSKFTSANSPLLRESWRQAGVPAYNIRLHDTDSHVIGGD